MVNRFRTICFVAAVALAMSGLSGCSAPRTAMPQVALLKWQGGTQLDLNREWNDWGDAHLQSGDIVFTQGDCYVLMGTVNFTKLSTDLTDSRFSHIGLIAMENGEAYVYDLRSAGCLRTRFGDLLAHRQVHQVAIKRHRETSPDAQARIAAFCQTVFQKREKYDDQLKLNNGRLYCTELVEAAYGTAGYSLSEPVAIQDLPNYARHTSTIQFVRAVTSIEPDQPILLPGNERFGVWANPSLDLILDLPDTKVHPPAGE